MHNRSNKDCIKQARKAKIGIESVRKHEGKTYLNIVVHSRKKIAQIIRELRMQFGFPRITRMSMPLPVSELSKAG